MNSGDWEKPERGRMFSGFALAKEK